MAAPSEEKHGKKNRSDFHPGAAPYGNFINYYSFNPPDNRIKFLSKDLIFQILGRPESDISLHGLPPLPPKISLLPPPPPLKSLFTVFDVGCNSGDLTISLYEHIVATTADTPSLHSDAKSIETKVDESQDSNEKTIESKCDGSEDSSEKNIEPNKCDGSQDTMSIKCSNQSCSPHSHTSSLVYKQDVPSIHILGCDIDPMLISRANQTNPHPNNIVFQEADVMDKEQFGKIASSFFEGHTDSNDPPTSIFNLTCCFSVTMWIHLHHGDQGLLDFLKDISTRTQFLIIEPQPWKCYRSAVRRVKKLGQTVQWRCFDELKIREDVEEQIQNYLVTECDMEIMQFLGETAWKRRVLLLKNCNIYDS